MKDEAVVIDNDAIETNLNTLEQFGKMLGSFGSVWETAIREESSCNAEIVDLLHEIEFYELDEKESHEFCCSLRDARRRRRRAKDLLFAMEPIKKYFDTHRSLEIDVFKVCREVKRLHGNQRGRIYKPRVREDLKIFQAYLEWQARQEQDKVTEEIQTSAI